MNDDGNVALNGRLDPPALAARFTVARRIQIRDFLAPSSAKLLSEELRTSRRWRHVINAGNNVFEIDASAYDALPADRKREITDAVMAEARDGFRFRYDAIRVADDRAGRAREGGTLGGFARLMNMPSTLAFLASITGDETIGLVDAQATRYRSGDFLGRHDDDVEGKDRRFAYVLGLTDGWRPEWGGLLLFNDGDGGIAEAIVPRFNALSLFEVPQPHSVSPIAPYAGGSRVSVTGWLRLAVPIVDE